MVFGSTTKIRPVAAFGNLEGMKIGSCLFINIFAKFLNCLGKIRESIVVAVGFAATEGLLLGPRPTLSIRVH